jgi:glycerophosphoryl diester phosphodiesterase
MTRCRNIAHRGARSLAPENTLAAARQGFLAGADLW